jgi:hypothetical protein
MEKINEWNMLRPVYWYGNSVNSPDDCLFIDMFGSVFEDDFNRAIELMPDQLPEHFSVKRYLEGIRDQSKNNVPDLTKIKKLYIMLEQMDERRSTNWRTIYPWLIELFQQHLDNDIKRE